MPREWGVMRQHDLPLDKKKVKIIRALVALNATTREVAKPSAEIASRAGVSERDVRHYCYHAQAGGIVDVCQRAYGTGHGFAFSVLGAELLGL